MRLHRGRRVGKGIAARYDYWQRKAVDLEATPGMRHTAVMVLQNFKRGVF
jgi:hypothetical protein